MSAGLSATYEVLGTTANEACVPVLLAALDASQPVLKDNALTALLNRRNPAAEGEILQRWNALPLRWQCQVRERAGWLSGAIRLAIVGADSQLYDNGCAAAVFTRDYDLIPAFIEAAEERSNPFRARASETALELVELLAEEAFGPRDYRIRRDLALQRQHALISLERTAGEYHKHGRRELIEAFLLLAQRESAVLKRLLQSPADPNFGPLVEVLSDSSRPGAMRLLLAFLDDPYAPLSAVQTLARRRDVAFLRQLMRKVGAEPTEVVRANLRRIEAIGWVTDRLGLLDVFSESEQPGVVQLAASSGIPRQQAYEVLAYILRHGKVSGRRAAAKALVEFQGEDANTLALKSLQDDDPQVRAAIALQLRGRGVPGAINRLISLLESTHQAEREAAQASLEEFRFVHYSANFDNLADEARRSIGPLVRRVDPQSLVELRMELDAPTRSRRKRGLEIVQAMDAVAALHDAVAALLKDEDQFLRVEAVRVLSAADSPQTRSVLREALNDSHPLVQEAAEAALTDLNQAKAEESSQADEASLEAVEPAETASEYPAAEAGLAISSSLPANR